MLEDYSSHFVVCLSVCLSVADLEDGVLLALQRDTNLKSATRRFNLPLLYSIVYNEIRPCSREKVKKLCCSSPP